MEYKFDNSIIHEMYKEYRYSSRRRRKQNERRNLITELLNKYSSADSLPQTLRFSHNYSWKTVNYVFTKLGFRVIRFERPYGKTKVQIRPWKKAKSA